MGLRTLRPVSAIAVVALVLDLSACLGSPPAIGRHLPGSFSVASDAFDQRVKVRFPLGSDEADLRAELARERFVITQDKDSALNFVARYHTNELVCASDWAIRWSRVDGNIANIEASYKEVCL